MLNHNIVTVKTIEHFLGVGLTMWTDRQTNRAVDSFIPPNFVCEGYKKASDDDKYTKPSLCKYGNKHLACIQVSNYQPM